MPCDYTSIQVRQLISAIWSKYLSLQGGEVATQRQILEKDREIFRKEQEISELRGVVDKLSSAEESKDNFLEKEFEAMVQSGVINDLISQHKSILSAPFVKLNECPNSAEVHAFGLLDRMDNNRSFADITDKGKKFFSGIYSIIEEPQDVPTIGGASIANDALQFVLHVLSPEHNMLSPNYHVPRSIPKTTPSLVRCPRSQGLALAARHQSLPGLGFGNHVKDHC
jgi:hypothetical protein